MAEGGYLNSTYSIAPKQVTAKLAITSFCISRPHCNSYKASIAINKTQIEQSKHNLLLCTNSFIAKTIQTLSTITLTTTYAFNKKMSRIQQLFVVAVVMMKSWTMVKALSDGSGLQKLTSTEVLNRRLRGIKTAPIRVKSRRLMGPMSKLWNARCETLFQLCTI
jgi:hypothetical protein